MNHIQWWDCSQYPVADDGWHRMRAIACMARFLAPYSQFLHTGHWWCPHRPHETLPLKLPTVETDKCEFDTYATIEWVTDPLISALTTGPLTSTVFYIESWRAKSWPQKRISADMTPQKPQKPPQKPQKPPQKPIAETKTEPTFDIKNSNRKS